MAEGGSETFYGAQSGAGGVQGFYGATPISKQTVTAQTTATTTALRTDIDAVHAALVALGLLTAG